MLVFFTNIPIQLTNIQPTKGSAFRGTVPAETYQHTKASHDRSGSSDDYLPPVRKKRRVESRSHATLSKSTSSSADVLEDDAETSCSEMNEHIQMFTRRK